MLKRPPTKKNGFLKLIPEKIRESVIYLEQVDVHIIQVDPRTLNENPKNWRIHTNRQKTTYSAFKKKYGWLGFIVYNLRTSRLLDGHMRIEESIKNEEKFVPVILKDLSEEEENEVLATLDNIGLLAKRNDAALKSLVESNKKKVGDLKTDNDRKLSQLNRDLEELTESNTPQVPLPQSKNRIRKDSLPETLGSPNQDDTEEDNYTPKRESETEVTVINDDVFFEGSTRFGIPELLPEKLCSPEDAPKRTYIRDKYGRDAYFCISSGPFDVGEPIGTIGFYTEDYRFEDAYSNAGIFAEYLKELDPVAVLSPDYSTYFSWPGAIRLYSVYRSRWCARFWQSLGFNVIPSIQWMDGGSFSMTKEFVLETLPECPVLSMQCRKMNIANPEDTPAELEEFISFLKLTCGRLKPTIFLLYGGYSKQKYLHGYLPKDTEFRFLDDFTYSRMKKRKARQ